MQTWLSLQSATVAQEVQPVPVTGPSGGHSRLVPVHVSGTSQTPTEGRHTVPAFPGTVSQNFTPPMPVAHLSTVHGLWSSQSASELQFEGVITQSDGSEFGCWDG